MTRLGLVVLPALLVLPPYARGDGTIFGCANTSTHKVRLIQTSPPACRATETPVSWNRQGPPGPPGLSIIDANGTLVGIPVGPLPLTTGPTPAKPTPALVRVGATWLELNLDVNGFSSGADALFQGGLAYESADCTGSPFWGQAGVQPHLYLVPTVHGHTAYYPVPESAASVTYHSVLGFGFTTTECSGFPNGTFLPPDECCIAPNGGAATDVLAPAVTLDLNTLGLVPPFHVEGP